MALGLLPIATNGCGGPSKVNIELRKENAALRSQIEQLERQQSGHLATIRTLESRQNTVPILPGERLGELFTVHGLRLGRLTGGADTDPDLPGDEALRVVVAPVDQHSDTLKAAGSFTIELFDLSDGGGRIGRWELDTQAARERWISSGLIDAYLFELPWQQAPESARLTLKVTFQDALTQRQITQERQIEVDSPVPATQPAAQ